MTCRWCGQSCGEREFCGPECFEEHEKAWAEYSEWSRGRDMVELEPPSNEWCGSSGNNV